jgi:hypothetical protein
MMPSKTAQALERMILARVRDEGACPADMQIMVRRVDGKWDVFASGDDNSRRDKSGDRR